MRTITLILTILTCASANAQTPKKPANLIPTSLPLVYKQADKFYLLNGLDTLQRENVWGIALGGIFIKNILDGTGRWQDAESSTWFDIKVFAEAMTFNGKKGRLPSLAEFLKAKLKTWEQHKNTFKELKDIFNATVDILNANGIKADVFGGFCWCADECDWFGEPNLGAYSLEINLCESKITKYAKRDVHRIAVYFPPK